MQHGRSRRLGAWTIRPGCEPIWLWRVLEPTCGGRTSTGGFHMRNRFLGALGAMAMAITVISLAAISVAAQAPSAAKAKTADKATTWTAPRTAWGEPDLQGVWANNNATPLERPKELEGRQHLSEDEVESLKQHAAELLDRKSTR